MEDQPNNQQNQNEGSEEVAKKSATEQIISDIIKGPAELFHDQRNEAYIAPQGDGSQIIRLDSGSFSKWLHYYYWEKLHKSLPRDANAKVADTLIAYATYKGFQHNLGVRVVKDDQGLWYDLGNGQTVQITEHGWTVVSEPPILFRRFQHQLAQAVPEAGGEIETLRLHFNIASDEDWLLCLVNLVAAFIPGFPHPILILYGPQGAGKTTPMRLMKKLIDPSSIQGLPLFTAGQDFMQIADHHAFLFFDNLSTMPTKTSDALARASTGDGFSKRKHYTNDDDFVYQIQLPIALNGINQVVTKPDLLDRSILIKLERIKPTERMSEEMFWEAFEGTKPQILGAIFDVLTKALSIYPSIDLDEVPRMADFTRWGCAIAQAIGKTQQQFLDAYKHNIAVQNEEAIDASPVAKAVIMLLKDRNSWEGSPAELLALFNSKFFSLNLSSNPLWPKAPEWMTRRLNDVATNLSVIGIHVDIKKTSEGRLISLSKELKDADNADLLTTDQDDSKTVESASL